MKYVCYIQNKYSEQAEFIRFLPEQVERGILYADKHKESTQKVIIELKNNLLSLDKLFSIQEENENIIYDFHSLSDMIAYAKHCRKNGIIHDYMYHAPAAIWGLVSILRYYQVSDIMVTEPLTFDIQQLSIVKRAGTRVHVIPTLCRTPLQREVEETGIKHFWVLPQHAHLYEEAIDVFEIIDGNDIRQQAIYEMYAVKGNYTTSPMSLLFTGLDVNMPPEVVPEDMVHRRLTCRQKCMIGNGSCDYCAKQLHFWQLMKDRASR